ncbi:phytase [Teredinibacter turnerae]|uniref:phytase n=1 Tax=Teredinibacter turnerae TaxID=2426 RepID=UPI00035F9996|nr:phytase [Teredinibacter turnerae]
MKNRLMFSWRYLFAVILLLASVGCQYVATNDTGHDHVARVEAEGSRLLLTGTSAVQLYPVVQADQRAGLSTTKVADIESIAVSAPWVVWSEDDAAELRLGRLQGDHFSDVATLPPLSHDLDVLCMAPVVDGAYDLFVSDGDGFFYHYWLDPHLRTTRLVRTFAVNPDIGPCTLSANSLVFNDPYLGVLAVERNPETVAVLRPAKSYEAALLELLTPVSQPVQTLAAPGQPWPSVHAARETQPVADTGDAADDPAILPGANTTWIAGTNKQRGLAIYDLDGRQLYFAERGRLNNVDALALPGGEYLLAASNRSDHAIDFFRAAPDRNHFAFVASLPITLDDPYGLCMARLHNGLRVWVSDSDHQVQEWRISSDYQGHMMRDWQFDGQVEGCVADTAKQQLYLGEEDRGIWRIDLADGSQTLMAAISATGLQADVEGLAIYHNGNDSLLVASSQGDDSYLVYRLSPWQQLAKFQITADLASGVDGASETDGLAVSSVATTSFPAGLLVVQDGRNRAPAQAQNFKLVDWREVTALLTQTEAD